MSGVIYMQVTILLDDPLEVTITDVCQYAVDMALRLQQALTHSNPDT